jgi:putative two-component system response regulator
VRLANYAVELGERLGLRDEELSALRLGGFLHDLGKIKVPDGVLLKPGPLSADEWRMIREHPVAGDRLTTPMRTLSLVRPVIRHHHERVDGRGYPDGLVGEEIPFLARVMSVVDVYDALRTRRPYKPALDDAEAMRLLFEGTRTGQLDPEIVRVFAEVRAEAARGRPA